MNIADNAQYGDLWSSIKDAAANIIPKKTIVGKMLQGDWSGAASGAVKLATQPSTPVVAKPATPPGVFAPGGFIEKNQTMLLAIAGLGAALLIVRMRPGARR
jgi:hypothetical protein